MISELMSQSSLFSDSPDRLTDLRAWCKQSLGKQLTVAEQDLLRDVLGDVFGYYLVQIDPSCQADSLDASRIRHRLVQSATEQGLDQTPGLLGRAEALPLKSDSVDAFVLSHVLELAHDAHQVLREIDRCLVAEGHLIVLAFNPFGWWGLRKFLFGWRGSVPWSLRFVSLPRLKDWLSLLGFDTIQTRYFFPYPPWQYGSGSSRKGTTLLQRLHRDHWPLLAAAYLLVARKRVTTLTPIKPRWRPRRSVLAGGVVGTSQGSVRPHV
jgi:SAM-dependent methyltransferase